MMIEVVGAGPAGLICAREIAKRGKNVKVFEEHSQIGEPVKCAGLVSKTGLENISNSFSESVLNECRKAVLHSPSDKKLVLEKEETHALVIDRKVFDRTLADEAEAEGAEVVLGKKWRKNNKDITVGADGAGSEVAEKLGIDHDFVYGFQALLHLKHDMDSVDLFFGEFAPNFFAWIIPVSDKHCRVGLGRDQGNVKKALKNFCKDQGINYKPEKTASGLIPVYDGKETVFPEQKTVLVGDAAGQVKAFSGGGVAIGGQCAKIAGKVIGEGKHLTDYKRKWRKEFEEQLEAHLKIRKIFNRTSFDELDDIFDLVEKTKLKNILENAHMDDPRTVLKELAKRPALALKLMKHGLKITS